jgi:hypothetical protein
VPFNVLPVNDPPVAFDDGGSTVIGNPVTIDVLLNDSDVDSAVLTITDIPVGPSNGSVVIDTENLTVTYKPSTGFSGIDKFDYEVGDGSGGTAVATVTVEVLTLAEAASQLVSAATATGITSWQQKAGSLWLKQREPASFDNQGTTGGSEQRGIFEPSCLAETIGRPIQ